MNKETILCPDCGNTIVTEYGFVSWCEKCDWNVLPKVEENKNSFLDALYENLGKKIGESLKQTAQKYELKNYGGILNRLLLVLLSLSVYTFNIAVLGLGIWLLVNFYTNLFAILGGVVLLGASWIVRLRFDPPLLLLFHELNIRSFTL